MRTLSSSSCQLRLEVVLRCHSLSSYTSPEPSSTSKEKSNKERVSSSPRTPTVLRITAGKLSSHRVASLQLSAAPSLSAPKRKTHSMS